MIDKKWFDEFGMLNSIPYQSPTENGPLYTAQAALLNLISFTDALIPVKKCFDDTDLFRRYPGSTWQDRGPDNIIGICSLSVFLATKLHEYGKSTFPKWVYNQEQPKKFSFFAWQGRQPGLIGLIKFCKEPEEWVPIRRFIWNIGVILTARSRKKDQYGRLHTSDRLLVETTFLGLFSQFYTYEWVKRWWRKKIDSDFGGWLYDATISQPRKFSGLEAMVGIYYAPTHPFIGVWK